MRQLIFLLVTFVAGSSAIAQISDNAGGRSTALAGAYTAMCDGWSAFHNQAGLNGIERLAAGVYYENRFGLSALSDKGFFIAGKLGRGTIAGSYHSFGYSEFSASKTGMAYAMGLGEKFDVGVQLNFYQTRIGENYGRSAALSAEGGFLYRLNSKLTIGAHLSNPSRAKLSEYLDERVAGAMRLGATYKLSKKVMLTSEVYKSTLHDPAVRAGLEYKIAESIVVRGGFASNPGSYTFGFGWKLNSWMLDMAAGYHPILGFNPHISLTFSDLAKP